MMNEINEIKNEFKNTLHIIKNFKTIINDDSQWNEEISLIDRKYIMKKILIEEIINLVSFSILMSIAAASLIGLLKMLINNY